MPYRLRFLIIAIIIAMAIGLAYLADRRGQVVDITVAAGPADGEGFQVASAIALVTHRYHPRLRLSVLETRGSVDNMRLLEEGRVDLATVQANIPGRPGVRLITALYPDALQLIARQGSGIQSVSDLRGRKIALPPVGGGQYNTFWDFAEHYGLGPGDFQALPMSNVAAAYALETGAVEAVFRVRTPGNAAVRELIEESGAYLVPIEQAEAMKLRWPALQPGSIPKGSYGGFPPLPEEDLPTAVVQSLLVARTDLADEIVQTITQVLFERSRDLVAITPSAGFVAAADGGRATFLPMHPGAQRYYDREKPSFLQENAELLAVLLSVFVLAGSGLIQLGSQRRKGRLDTYNHQILALYSDAIETTDRERLMRHRSELMRLLGRVVDDAEEGRITAEGFHIFSFTWDAVNEAISERLTEAES